MPVINRPDETVFASSPKPNEVQTFPNLERGWGISFEQTQGIPPMEWFNFLFKRADEKALYFLQRGLPEWSAITNYPANAFVQYNGKTYRSLKANVGANPAQQNSDAWVRWAADYQEIQDIANNYIPNSRKSSAINSDSEDTMATSKAVKTAYDKGEEALNVANSKWTQQHATDNLEGTTILSHKTNGTDKTKAASEFALGEVAKTALPVGAVLAFPSAVQNPTGFLRADGSTFNARTFPDLYRALGNSNRLPNLTRSDIGALAYFPFDEIPSGWLECNGNIVNQSILPELYEKLGTKYGKPGQLPRADDRFIRNAGNGLRVGQMQEDAIRNITGEMKASERNNSGNTQFIEDLFCDGAFERIPGNKSWSADQGGNSGQAWGAKFDASRVVPTADENRPKSIVFKLCIKARNTFDDVVFWVKAFGEVANQGLLDASQLAQSVQGKADRNHTHHARDIVDFNHATNQLINAAFTYQKIGGFDVRKYADGTMLQSYTYEVNDLADWSVKSFNWAIAFANTPMIFGKPTTSHRYNHDCGINILTTSNNAMVEYVLYEHAGANQGLCRIQFFAIGRWK